MFYEHVHSGFKVIHRFVKCFLGFVIGREFLFQFFDPVI